MYSGSISNNRITVGLQPTVRQALMEEARVQGIKIPELIRYILGDWAKYQKIGKSAEQEE